MRCTTTCIGEMCWLRTNAARVTAEQQGWTGNRSLCGSGPGTLRAHVKQGHFGRFGLQPLELSNVVGLEAVPCSTGGTLAKEQAEAASKEGVLKALSTAAISLRGKLG